MKRIYVLAIRLAVLACVMCVASGCMLMYRGATEPFTVLTTPEGATVKLSDGQTCISPCTTEVKRRADIAVEISKDGCKDEDETVHSRLEGRTVVNAGLSYAGLYVGLPLMLILGIESSGTAEDIAAIAFVTGLGFFIGGIPTDAATGSMKSISPNPLMVTLDCS